MLGSLITKFLGLELYQPLVAFAPMAAALIVFTAGLEVDMDFLRSHKFSIVLSIFFEYVILLPIIYIIYRYISPSLSYIILALTIASNEAFALAVGHDEETRKYGIVLSVLEDSIAVFLLAIGFYTFTVGYTLELELLRLIMFTVIIILILFVFSSPFARMIGLVKHPEAKSLIAILYIFILILISESLSLPEALVVFLGGIFLSYYTFDEELNHWMHSYMYLALMGFVVSLPYMVEASFTLNDLIYYSLLGFLAGIGSYIIRSLILYISTNLAGIRWESSLLLSLTLSNSGEFGLIVLASLALNNIIDTWAFFITLFGYATNLTLVSYVANNIEKASRLFLKLIPNKLHDTLVDINSEVITYFEYLRVEEEAIKCIYQIFILTALAYLSTGLLYLIRNPFESSMILGFQLSVIFVTIYFTYKRFVERILKTIKRGLILPLVFEVAISMLVFLALIESLRITFTSILVNLGTLLSAIIVSGILAAVLIEVSYFIIKKV